MTQSRICCQLCATAHQQRVLLVRHGGRSEARHPTYIHINAGEKPREGSERKGWQVPAQIKRRSTEHCLRSVQDTIHGECMRSFHMCFREPLQVT